MSIFRWKLALAIAAGALGCAEVDPAAAPHATIGQALEQIPNTGFVPYPIVFEDGADAPKRTPGGSFIPAWDGSNADLMAADAYSACSVSSPATKYETGVERSGSDQYLRYLRSLMSQATCGAVTPFPDQPEANWALIRQEARCNVDPNSGTFAVAEPFERDINNLRDISAYVTFYEPPSAPFWGVKGFNGGTAGLLEAQATAGLELETGSLNLCMAQHLREQLNSGQTLFISSDEHVELLGVVQERAQLAVLGYSILAKIITARDPSPPPMTLTAGGFHEAIMIRAWADRVPAKHLERLGEDFATAIALQVQTATEYADVLQRLASSRPTPPGELGQADRDWAAGQPRLRLLNLLYGGDPIGDLRLPDFAGRGRVGTGRSGRVPPYVSVDMRDPRLRTTLGLARAADAVFLKVEPDQSGFAVEPSADRMYRAIEANLLAADCERATPGSPACDEQGILDALPPLADLDFSETLTWKRHRVEPDQARVLTQALSEAFGELVRPAASQEHRQFDGVFHLFGKHCSHTLGDEQWVHVDKDFDVEGYEGHDLMVDFAELAYLPGRFVLDGNLHHQGLTALLFTDTGPTGTWAKLRNLGVVPALTFAREALLDGSSMGAGAKAFFDASSEALPGLERAVGQRTVSIRPRLTGGKPTFSHAQDAAGSRYEVVVTTRSDDPLDELVLSTDHKQLHTLAIDPDTTTIEGVDRTVLDGIPGIAGSQEVLTGFGAGYVRRTFGYSLPATPSKMTLLRGEVDGKVVYAPLFHHKFQTNEGYYVSFGGTLNELAARAFAVLPFDWSAPAFDAFGLPSDWFPPSDASLVGGASGEPSYQFYLRAAKQAATEASIAVQTAIDSLTEETLQDVALQNSERKAEGIAELDTTALCGDSNCEVETVAWEPVRPLCERDAAGNPLSLDAKAWCNDARDLLADLLGSAVIAKRVVDADANAPPSFPDVEGSELQRVLLRQWLGVQKAQRAVQNTLDLGVSLGGEVAAAKLAKDSALAAFTAAFDEVVAEFAQLDVNDAQVAADKAEFDLATANRADSLARITAIRDRECAQPAYDQATRAGRSYTEDRGLAVVADPGGLKAGIRTRRNDGKSWSAGPVIAQQARCQSENDRVQELSTQIAGYDSIVKLKTEDLLARRAGLTEFQRRALTSKLAAALQLQYASVSAAGTVYDKNWAQLGPSLSQAQQAMGEVLAAGAELAGLQLKAGGVLATAELETSLARFEAEARFGIRRKFRSFDLWRARALLESARRLAVAARRAVEANFVVDLSELRSRQAFVDAPALWADEVYRPDLDAPSVVGLSVSQDVQGAVFPNQLLDYVENLERFVQGYTITYPTSVAVPDTEAITLPGPDFTERFVDGDVLVETLEPGTLGWQFYCPDLDAWVGHPGTGEVPLASRADTACAGAKPTRARYQLALDPWGRLNSTISNTPLEQRHNVRWRRFAVNLVGTGIRDCEQTTEPLQCYSEPFLRFAMIHVGPAWSTNHAGQWRSFDLPIAAIEDGKALATEEWVDPVANSWNLPFVSNVTRGELAGRPVDGSYELTLELTPDIRLDRIERVQLLVETDYWVRQQ